MTTGAAVPPFPRSQHCFFPPDRRRRRSGRQRGSAAHWRGPAPALWRLAALASRAEPMISPLWMRTGDTASQQTVGSPLLLPCASVAGGCGAPARLSLHYFFSYGTAGAPAVEHAAGHNAASGADASLGEWRGDRRITEE